MDNSGDEAARNYAFRKGLPTIIIASVILSVIWGIAGWYIPYGSLMAVINIVFLLLSLYLGWTMAMAMRLRYPFWVSALVSAVLWVLIFGVFRGFF